jgi:DNA polymerase-3 subunit alpha
MIFAEESKIFSSKFESLIKIDYFNQFGNNKKLLSAYEEFKSGKSRYGKNLKDATKEKRIIELKEIFNNLPNARLPFIEQIVTEEEILGYIQLTFPKINKRFVYIVSLDLTFAPRVQSYCLSNGKQASLKVYRKTYENNPFGGGEILYCKSFKEKPSSKFVDGKYVDDPNETTWWLTNYTVVTPEQFNAILEKNG